MRTVKFITTDHNTINVDSLIPLASYIEEQGLKRINDMCGPSFDEFCDRSNYIVLETRASLDKHGIYIGNINDGCSPELVTDEFGNITLVFHRIRP